jgi:EAL domain-containing protein (putative c-di-GMP-specific phosphodiesterase class I)
MIRLFPSINGNKIIDKIIIPIYLVRNIKLSDEIEIITKKIISMARELNLKTVAEEVETGDELRALKGLGCDEMSGLVICQPVVLSGVIEFLEARGR